MMFEKNNYCFHSFNSLEVKTERLLLKFFSYVIKYASKYILFTQDKMKSF